MENLTKIPITYIRGGTSKGAFILEENLPKSQQERDLAILTLYGSPDKRQIDGIGGADPLTSKVAIIKKSNRKGIDVDYTFGQVAINRPYVDYKSNCGNMSAGVGLFAIQKGLVKTDEPYTKIKIYNTNTKKTIESTIPVKNGKVHYLSVKPPMGVPSTGAVLTLGFHNPAGSKTGKLLPTGNPTDELILPDGKSIEVSYVDVTTPSVFVNASSIGLSGIETPDELESNKNALELLEYIRSKGAERIGLVDDYRDATIDSPSVPKVIYVSEPITLDDDPFRLNKNEYQLIGRAMSMQTMHKAFAVTGGICTASAAVIEGTVVNKVTRNSNDGKITIAHPSGIMNFEIKKEVIDGETIISEAKVQRTAKIILDGTAYV